MNFHEWPRSLGQNVSLSSRQVMRIKKNINYRIITVVEPIPNSPNQHYKNCMVESKENYSWSRSWRWKSEGVSGKRDILNVKLTQQSIL